MKTTISLVVLALVASVAHPQINAFSEAQMMNFMQEASLYGFDLRQTPTPKQFIKSLPRGGWYAQKNGGGGQGKNDNGNSGNNGNNGNGGSGGSGSSSGAVGGNVINNSTGDNSQGSNVVTIANVEVPTDNPIAVGIGLAVGLQQDRSTSGSCVYSSVAVLVSYDLLLNQIEKVIKKLDFSLIY